MKKFLKAFGTFALVLLTLTMCGEKTPQPFNPNGSGGSSKPVPKPKPKVEYEWEKDRKALLKNSDLVLIYGGGDHRNPFEWSQERLTPYVVYKDRGGSSHWLFDSFLMIEFAGVDKQFCSGYGKKSADKEDWKDLLDYYFSKDNQLGALEKVIDRVAKKIGNPAYKHQIVLTLPEPIVHQDCNNNRSSTRYWGTTTNGKTLDFSKDVDRVEACKWYIDYARKKFSEAGFKHLDLAGFYWVAETSEHSSTILKQISSYLNSMHYSFNWIPYYKSKGHEQWDTFGFNYAYYQPTHFFNADVSDTRLDYACEEAKDCGMYMEMEFDGRVLSYNTDNKFDDIHPGGLYSERLRSYMAAFKRHGFWQNKPLAYYEGGGAIYWMERATDSRDVALYHDFCEFVVSRPYHTIGK